MMGRVLPSTVAVHTLGGVGVGECGLANIKAQAQSEVSG